MSKRLRLENERILLIKDEEKEELDKLKLMKERMYAPIIWRRMTSGFRIQDIKEKHYAETLDIIKQYYIPEDVLSKNSEMIDDEVSTKSFLDQCLFQLKDTTSIMAVNETDEKTVAVFLLRVVNKEDFGRVFSRTILMQGEAQEKCVHIKTTLNRKVDIYADFNCETFLRLYAICVIPEYRGKGIGFTMMRTALDVARSMHIPVVMGIFTNFAIQKLAKRIGMQVMSEINYVDWRNKDKNLIFDDPGAGNYTCALMAGEVPPESIPEPSRSRPVEVVEEKGPKITRKDKRNQLAKKKK